MTSSLPFKLTKSVLHIIIIFSFVHVRVFFCSRFFPNSFALLSSIYKHSTVNIAISPPILSITFCSSIVIFTQEYIAVCKNIRSLTVSQRLMPLTLIPISILPLMNAVAMSHVFSPLAYKTVSTCIFPYSVAML